MGSMFGGGKQTTETSPWKPAQGALENILNQAGKLFDEQGGVNAEFIEREIANLTPEMQEAVKNLVNTDKFQNMAQGIQDSIKSGQSAIGQATGGLGALAQQGITSENLNAMAKDLYDSDLVKSQKESLGKEVQSGLAKSVQGINQAAGGSGSMGSSRAGVAEGVAIGEASEAYATGAANIENAARTSAYTQALGTLQGNQQTALGSLSAMGQLGASGMGAVSGAYGQMGNLLNTGFQNQLTGAGITQSQAQNILNNKWFNATGQQNAGWNNLNNYLGIAGSIGGMGSQTTSSGGGSGLGGALVGAAGQMGSAAIGAGGWAGMFSDARLKDNVELVEKCHVRVNAEGEEYVVPALYKWEWNAKAIQLFAEQKFDRIPPAFGVIAQDLEEFGFERFVGHVLSEVDGLEGEVLSVDYASLMAYIFQGDVV